jgi:hypothetical protein
METIIRPAALACALLAVSIPAVAIGPAVDFDRSAPGPSALVQDLAARTAGSGQVAGALVKAQDLAWHAGSFTSADGALIQYKYRLCPDCGSATVFVGGLTLAESFETLFAQPGRPKTSQFFIWLRGFPPTQWHANQHLLEADARDVARFMGIAAQTSGAGRVNLALHSYANFIFQKMVQMAGDDEVGRALGSLQGGQVLFLDGTTNCKDCQAAAGPEGAQIASTVKLFEDWLDAGDDTAAAMAASAQLNPLLGPSVDASLAGWDMQRTTALAAGTQQADAAAVKDMETPWDHADNGIREKLLEQVKKNAGDPGWQEALMKRSNDTYQFDFTQQDVETIRRLGLRLDMVHAAKDQLIQWPWAQITMKFFGIPAPDQLPAPGSVLRDASGRFSFTVVAGDHYFPLKDPEGLASLLSP